MEVTNIRSELLLISDFYKNKMDFVKYSSLIDPYLFFSETKSRTLYRLISLYYEDYEEYKDVDFRIFLQNDEEYRDSYLKVGGIEAIEELITLESSSLDQNFKAVQKYALLREYDNKGFDVTKIMKHESFSQLTAKKIADIVQSTMLNIRTKLDGNIEDNITITENATGFVEEFMKNPEVGVSFGSKSLDDVFRGFRKGQFIVEGLNSNMGKTRRMVALAVHIALVENEKVFLMSNEMDEKDIKSAVLIAIMNHPKFWELAKSKNISLKENDMRLGLYKDEFGEYIYRNKDEGDHDFVERVRNNSRQFREVYEILTWIEAQTNIKYKHMRFYSDNDIELEIRKEVFGNNCSYVFYDTLKAYKGGDWSALKQTATELSETAKELNIGIYANLQLTDESQEVNIFDMDSRNIASAKHVYHVLDSFLIGKRLEKEEYSNYVQVTRKGKRKQLEERATYYAFKVSKARSAGTHVTKNSVILYRVDLNKNIWFDIGLLEKSM